MGCRRRAGSRPGRPGGLPRRWAGVGGGGRRRRGRGGGQGEGAGAAGRGGGWWRRRRWEGGESEGRGEGRVGQRSARCQQGGARAVMALATLFFLVASCRDGHRAGPGPPSSRKPLQSHEPDRCSPDPLGRPEKKHSPAFRPLAGWLPRRASARRLRRTRRPFGSKPAETPAPAAAPRRRGGRHHAKGRGRGRRTRQVGRGAARDGTAPGCGRRLGGSRHWRGGRRRRPPGPPALQPREITEKREKFSCQRVPRIRPRPPREKKGGGEGWNRGAARVGKEVRTAPRHSLSHAARRRQICPLLSATHSPVQAVLDQEPRAARIAQDRLLRRALAPAGRGDAAAVVAGPPRAERADAGFSRPGRRGAAVCVHT